MAKARPKTKQQLQAARDRLLERRAQLEAEIAELQPVRNQGQTTTDVEFDTDPSDAGTTTFERERAIQLAGSMRDLAEKLDRALEKTQDGTYGICESCGRNIDAARLKALPYATLCIECARREKGRY